MKDLISELHTKEIDGSINFGKSYNKPFVSAWYRHPTAGYTKLTVDTNKSIEEQLQQVLRNKWLKPKGDQ